MALDKGLVQTINLKANGDQLLGPLKAMGREINKLVGDLNKFSDGMSKGAHKTDDELRRTVQTMQRLVGEANTLHNVLTASNNRRRDSLLGILDDQSLGKKTSAVSRMTRDLQQTVTVTDALTVRLAQLNRKFAELGQTGRRANKLDLAKELNIQTAMSEVKQLERQLKQLDRATSRQTPAGQGLRSQIATEFDRLLRDAQNPSRSNFTGRLNSISSLVEEYRDLPRKLTAASRAERQALNAEGMRRLQDREKLERQEVALEKKRMQNLRTLGEQRVREINAEERAAEAARRQAAERANLSTPLLAGDINRASSRFKFTPDEVRAFPIRALNAELETGKQRLLQYQDVLKRALAEGRSTQGMERLTGAFDRLKMRVAETQAQIKAFESQPVERIKAFSQSLMGPGGLALLGRSFGIGLGLNAMFGVVGALRDGAAAAIEFEDGLKKLQAISGATDAQMEKLGRSIMGVASNSRYSVQEIVEATTTIAQAGYSASESAKILQDSLMLAAGSGSSPTEAVDTLTSALGAFQLQAGESTRVVDTMMQALNQSKLNINQLQQAIQYAGATAKENGVRFEELATIAASLSNAGIRSGSTIGTGLRQLMVDLKTPTEDFKKELKSLGLTMADVDVRSLGLAEVVKRLTDAGFSAEQAYESFEVRAASSFLAFRNQIDNYDKLSLAIANSGAAAKANEKAMDSLSAQWTRFKNVLVDLMTGVLSPITETLKRFFHNVADGIQWINEWAESHHVLADALGWTTQKQEDLQTRANEANEALNSQQQKITSIDDAIGQLILRQDTLSQNTVALQAETITLSTRFQGLASHLDTTSLSYGNLVSAMLAYRNEQRKQEGLNAREVKRTAGDQADNFARAITNQRRDLGDWHVQFQGKANQAAMALVGSTTGNNRGNVVARALELQGYAEDLKDLKSKDPNILRLIQELDRGVKNLRELKQAWDRYDDAELTVARAAEDTSPAGDARTNVNTVMAVGFSQDQAANRRKPGSGNASAKNRIAQANRFIASLQAQVDGITGGDVTSRARRMEIQADIEALEAMVHQMERTFRVQEEDAAKAAKGSGLREGDVITTLDRPGAGFRHSSGFGRRRAPTAGASTFHKGHDYAAAAGTPVRAAAGGFVTFAGQKSGYGNVVIIDHGNGIETWYGHLKDGSILVSAGASVGRGDQIAGVGSTGTSTGNHLHFEVRKQGSAVDPNTTGWKFTVNPGEANKAGDTAQEQAERQLAQLLGETARNRSGQAGAALDNVIKQAKSGSTPIPQMKEDFERLAAELRSRKGEEFDLTHPTDGMSVEQIKALADDRVAFMDKAEEEILGKYEDMWRAIADNTGKNLDAALATAQAEFDRRSYEIEQQVESVASHGRTLSNGVNRNRFGVGAQYRQQRAEFDARLSGDRQLAHAMGWHELSATIARDAAKSEFDQLDPNSPNAVEAKQKLAEAEAKLLEIQKARADVLRSIDERTQDVSNSEGTLGSRLRESLAAWGENSGVMDSWGKTLENSVGPALDMFTDQLATMFTSIVDGTATVKQALVGFIKAFAQFVLQIVAKALALMAVKAILSAFGLQFNDGPGGVTIGKKAFNGGLVETGIRHAFNGGPVMGLYGGGSVDRGVSNRDSALYKLARGEYVVRNKSVRELGLPFMDAINRHGAQGLAKMGAAGTAFASIQAPKQETNVWVVADRKQAGLTKNDILVTLSDDILQNGPTKKLIKQVAQGA